jgi:hypothetical protein
MSKPLPFCDYTIHFTRNNIIELGMDTKKVSKKDFWYDLRRKKKIRKCKYVPLYVAMYLSVCILFGDKYIFTVTVTFTTYILV